MCGGTSDRRSPYIAISGLSPRVRGNPPLPCPRSKPKRSIPACAGEPAPPHSPPSPGMVYPRVCGGTAPACTRFADRSGLSPRVRGNPGGGVHDVQLGGSIPACAGEPAKTRPFLRRRSVYPRVCGGTLRDMALSRRRSGLSPRVRGNPGNVSPVDRVNRSIPACAGEPGGHCRASHRRRVYPRVCGGTHHKFLVEMVKPGLSPRVRGNRGSRSRMRQRRRSIPACAGEPDKRARLTTDGMVYPRVCGGTLLGRRLMNPMIGLSPRVRGNRSSATSARNSGRSIPACAGEPPQHYITIWHDGVYPRVCGGTRAFRLPSGASTGLSPRVRGNRGRRCDPARRAGSIPACAGEPTWWLNRRCTPGVYPRVCGGTHVPGLGRQAAPGLSPRVRGNRRRDGHQQRPGRSIPACAGEPIRHPAGA